MSESASAGKKGDWLPLEADPVLMSTYLHKLGADPNELYTFHDVYGVDDEMLGMVPQPVLAVLLLFPISEASEAHKENEKAKITATGDAAQKVSPNLYWMKQVRPDGSAHYTVLHARSFPAVWSLILVLALLLLRCVCRPWAMRAAPSA